MSKIIYKPNQVIIKEGERYDGNIYILNKGRLAVMLNNEKVSEITGSGLIVDGISWILQCPRTATIKALDESEVTVYEIGLEKVIEQAPSVAAKVMMQIASRLIDTTALQVDAIVRAKNLEKMNERLRKQYVDLKERYDEQKSRSEETQQKKEELREHGLLGKIIHWNSTQVTQNLA